jgi:hypothetical protein
MRVEIMRDWNTPGKGSFLEKCDAIEISPIEQSRIIAAM